MTFPPIFVSLELSREPCKIVATQQLNQNRLLRNLASARDKWSYKVPAIAPGHNALPLHRGVKEKSTSRLEQSGNFFSSGIVQPIFAMVESCGNEY